MAPTRVRFTETRIVKDGAGTVYEAGKEYDLPRASVERWQRRGCIEVVGPSPAGGGFAVGELGPEVFVPGRSGALAAPPTVDARIVQAVICVLKRPDTRRKGVGWTGYTPDHVLRLRDQVAFHAPGLRFMCLTDMTVPEVECLPLLRAGWPGWWSKIELFRPGLLDGPTLYLDLDSVVIDDPRKLAFDSPLTAMADPWRFGLNSSVLALDGDLSGIFQRFADDPEGAMKAYKSGPKAGDQGFVEDAATQLGIKTGRFDTPAVASFKAHCQDGPPAGAVVVTFHGSPKPEEVKDGWVIAARSAKPPPRMRHRSTFVTPPSVPPTLDLPPAAQPWRYNFLVWLIQRLGWTHGAELGIWQGKTLLHLLQAAPDLHMIGVDLWAPQPENPGPEGYEGWDHAAHEATVRKRAAAFGDRVSLFKDLTVNAARDVADGSLDFVFIDADHSEVGCRADIEAWTPKLKPTGWLIGHDISWPGVKAAVDALVPGYEIGPDVVWFRPVNPVEGWQAALLK